MNELQRTIIIGTILIVFTGLYPPWIFQPSPKFWRNEGYSFLWAPPHSRASIDFDRLLLEWIVVIAATIGSAAVSIAKDNRRKNIEKED